MGKHHEHWRRSFVKTVTYRVVIVVVVYITALFVTKNSRQSLEIAGWNAVLATVIYYLHERFWAKIHWGRNK